MNTETLLGLSTIGLLALTSFLFVNNWLLKKKVKKMENDLSENREKSLEKEKYLSLIIHDVKNLMLPISTYSELLSLEGISSEKAKETIEKLNKTVSNVMDTATQWLNEVKEKEKSMDINPSVFYLHEKVNNMLTILKPIIEKKQLSISNDIEIEQKLFADLGMVDSIIINLLNNAVKFTPEKGKIRIYGKKIDSNFFEMSIQDSGCGMDEEMIRKVFIEKQQITTKGTDGEAGTGLGLLFVKELVEKNGGFMHIKNNRSAGKGTTFTVVLPETPHHL